MNEFVKRTLTGAGFLIVMLLAVLWSLTSLYILLLIVSSVALYEIYSIFKLREYKPFTTLGIISGIIITSLVFINRQQYIEDKYLCLILVPFIAIWFSFFFVKRGYIIDSIIITVFGLIYILLPVSLIPFLTQNTLTNGYDPQIFLGTLFIIWIYDTAAYLFGLLVGKHKMAPRLSPKKTWEGFVAGAVTAFLCSMIISRYFTLLDRLDWMIISIVIILFSTAGDLFESLLKREAGIKDSGKFLPGHGGILDRFDSVFLSIPFVFLYLFIHKI